ncbi:MAG: SDR family NAD(P)-dependent oxidoreductase [Nannocystaceae bacterium]|nr:SDR family NAD(P)-dependent oxidoreductase [Myxococcales bacterium]
MTTQENAKDVAVVVGAGPGLGGAVARRFAREGFAVALLARREESVAGDAAAIREAGGEVLALAVDTTDDAAVAAAHARVCEGLGPPTALIYNAGAFKFGGVLELEPAEFETCWRVNCMGAFLWARRVLPAMVERGAGTILLTGATAALRGSANFAGLAVGKFGLRALAQSLAREFGPQGIHVAHPVIDGQIATPRQQSSRRERPVDSYLDKDAIAEAYWQLHVQPRSVWTLEQDLRPYVERF